jgi:hypothetical protein
LDPGRKALGFLFAKFPFSPPSPFHQPKILTAKAYITNTVLFCPLHLSGYIKKKN